jgi:CheY-like chemotaxis protein
MHSDEIEILVVEDNAADARLVKEALAETGLRHHICRSVDGEDAINYLRECAQEATARFPDVIVLDLNMPKVNGHQFLKLMKEEKDLPEIPVIVLTVSQDEEDLIQALERGMNFYLRKPPSAATIGPILDRVVSLWART